MNQNSSILTTFIFLLISFTTFGQFGIGIQTGIQATTIINQNDFDAGGEIDFEVPYKLSYGLQVSYRLHPSISLISGVIFSPQGQNYITGGNDNANYATNLNYLKIPILAQWTVKPESKVNFVLQGGFQYSLLTSAESSRARLGAKQVPFGTFSRNLSDVKMFYEPGTFDVVFAPGINVRLNEKMNLGALVRVDYSISESEDRELKPDARNATSNATIGLGTLYFQYNFGN